MERKLQFKRVKDITAAEKIWKLCVKQTNLNDVWEYRYCFYKYFGYELYFFVGYDGEDAVGLLPLQYNFDEKYLEFFGGYFFSDNQVYVKEGFEDTIPQFYNQISGPAKLVDIIGKDAYTMCLPFLYNKYFLNIKDFKSVEDYLRRIKQSRRHNIERKIRVIEREEVSVVKNNFNDVDKLIELNIRYFKDNSFFNKPFRRENFFQDLVKLPLNPHIFSFFVGNVLQGVTLSLVSNGVYAYLQSGKEALSHPSMGTFMHMHNLQAAIGAGVKIFDAGVIDYGWKEGWGMEKIPQHQFTSLFQSSNEPEIVHTKRW